MELWAQARALHGKGGPYLFGTFGAVDIMFAPIVTRFVTYSIAVPRFAATYVEAILDHPWMREWIDAAQEEPRSEEHTSELQSLMRISYAVFCLKKKKNTNNTIQNYNHPATS